MGVVFDLDQTLIDSSIALELRRNREWERVYRLIPNMKPFEGISDLLHELNNKNIPICIVTTSPRPYCSRVISYWGWDFVKTVCYHDTRKHKPDPDPILKGIELLGERPQDVISIGDEERDVGASKSAGVTSVGVTWGCTDTEALERANPDFLFYNVEDLSDFLLEK